MNDKSLKWFGKSLNSDLERFLWSLEDTKQKHCHAPFVNIQTVTEQTQINFKDKTETKRSI